MLKEKVIANWKNVSLRFMRSYLRNPRYPWQGYHIKGPLISGNKLYIPYDHYINAGYIDLTDGSLHPERGDNPTMPEARALNRLETVLDYINTLKL